jgi:hypothetical protein
MTTPPRDRHKMTTASPPLVRARVRWIPREQPSNPPGPTA